MSPRGAPFSQARARQLAAGPGVLLVCGRFEGVDERVIEAHGLEEVSVGDFVLSGGEIAAMAVMDCCVRLLPGVMGEPASASEESFEDGLLEYPHYTRPASWPGPTESSGACRRFWSRATMARWPSGGWRNGKRSRGGGGPICGQRRRLAKADDEKR